jgi:hypothetical protein
MNENFRFEKDDYYEISGAGLMLNKLAAKKGKKIFKRRADQQRLQFTDLG